MKKIFTLFILAIVCCLNAAAGVVPEDGKQYLIKVSNQDLYIVLATGSDSQGGSSNATAASLGVVGTPFTFNGSVEGFTLTTDDGKYFGTPSSGAYWNVSSTVDTEWYVSGTEDGYYIYRNDGKSGCLGLDNVKAGAGIYTDKAPGNKGYTFVFEEYEAPAVVHTVTASVDGGEAIAMNGDDENGYVVSISVGTGDHTVTVNYDGTEYTLEFTTTRFVGSDNVTYDEGLVEITFKDGTISVSGQGIGGTVDPQPSYPPLYILGFDNNWDYANPSLTVDANTDGTYTITFDTNGYSRMAISAAYGDRDTFDANRIGVTDEDAELKTDDVLGLVRGSEGYNLPLEPGHWSFLVNLDAMTLTVLEGKESAVVYVLGIDGNWNPAKPSLTVKAGKDGSYNFSYEVTEKTWFALGTKLGADSDDWKGFNAGRLGAPEADFPLYKDDVAYFELGKDTSFAIEPGNWSFSINQKMSKITVLEGAERSNVDGINTITTSAAAGIYDMQGRRVVAPTKGLYIQNGKTIVK